MRRPAHEIPEGTLIRRSSGIGHIPGDETFSTTKMVPIQLLKRYTEYDRTGAHAHSNSEQMINTLADHLRSGGVIKEPLYLSHSTKDNWGYLAEGHHRLAAAERAGLTHVPLTVWSMEHDTSVTARKKEGLGRPLHMDTDWDKVAGTQNYQPPNIHPDHFRELR